MKYDFNAEAEKNEAAILKARKHSLRSVVTSQGIDTFPGGADARVLKLFPVSLDYYDRNTGSHSGTAVFRNVRDAAEYYLKDRMLTQYVATVHAAGADYRLATAAAARSLPARHNAYVKKAILTLSENVGRSPSKAALARDRLWKSGSLEGKPLSASAKKALSYKRRKQKVPM